MPTTSLASATHHARSMIDISSFPVNKMDAVGCTVEHRGWAPVSFKGSDFSWVKAHVGNHLSQWQTKLRAMNWHNATGFLRLRQSPPFHGCRCWLCRRRGLSESRGGNRRGTIFGMLLCYIQGWKLTFFTVCAYRTNVLQAWPRTLGSWTMVDLEELQNVIWWHAWAVFQIILCKVYSKITNLWALASLATKAHSGLKNSSLSTSL